MTAQQVSQFNANTVESLEQQQDVTDAFENIAAATAADRTAVANLTESNQDLSNALKTRSTELQAANIANATLQQKVAKSERNFTAIKATLSSTPRQSALPPAPAPAPAPPPTGPHVPGFYRAPTC